MLVSTNPVEAKLRETETVENPLAACEHRTTDAYAPAAPEQDLPSPGVDDPLNPKP
jgi:hypothetical protein